MKLLHQAFALSLLGGLCLSACSSNSASSDRVALCKQGCSQAASLCYADAGAVVAAFKTLCESDCTSASGAGTAVCTNSNVVAAAIKVCQSKTTCEEYRACTDTIPACTGGGGGGAGGGSSGAGTGGATGAGTGGATAPGTGGVTGAGGTTTAGTGGAGGASSAGATCTDLSACCARVANATIKAACNQQITTGMAQVASGQITQAQADTSCAMALAVGKSIYCP